MTPIEQPAPESKQHNVVEDDTTCVKCGYNLRTLRRDGACPECGAAVEESSPGRACVIERHKRLRAFVRQSLLFIGPLTIAAALAIALGVSVLWMRPYCVPATGFVMLIFACFLISSIVVDTQNVARGTIYVGRNIALNRRGARQLIRIHREEVTRISESRIFGILIRTRRTPHGFDVMPEIEHYEEIRARLTTWKTIEPDRRAVLRIVGIGAGAFAALLAPPTVVVGATAWSVIMAWAISLVFLIGMIVIIAKGPMISVWAKVFSSLFYLFWIFVISVIALARITHLSP